MLYPSRQRVAWHWQPSRCSVFPRGEVKGSSRCCDRVHAEATGLAPPQASTPRMSKRFWINSIWQCSLGVLLFAGYFYWLDEDRSIPLALLNAAMRVGLLYLVLVGIAVYVSDGSRPPKGGGKTRRDGLKSTRRRDGWNGRKERSPRRRDRWPSTVSRIIAATPMARILNEDKAGHFLVAVCAAKLVVPSMV
jgi:hypothetical protein